MDKFDATKIADAIKNLEKTIKDYSRIQERTNNVLEKIKDIMERNNR